MYIGILVLFVNSFGQKGLYNSQEIGMAKEMARRGHDVKIYKCVDSTQKRSDEIIYNNVLYHLQPVKTIGNNAITNFDWIDSSLDALVCFSDIQLYTGKAYQWARRNNIRFIPYVGITHSTSPSTIKRTLINLCARSAYTTYKKTGALTKTNAVKQELSQRGIKDLKVAPVGLDFDLLQKEYEVPRDDLISELGLSNEGRYILLVGRIANDRNPLDVVPIFERLHQADPQNRLLIIGKGPLKDELDNALNAKGLSDDTLWIEQVANNEMWKYYRVASALVSFSRTEIFGMSILEAMFYELPVFVLHAPGPDDIIVDGKSGFLFSTTEEMADEIVKSFHTEIGANEHKRVVDNFSWSTMVDCVLEGIE